MTMAGLLDTGAQMQATPRTNRLAGLLADALGAVDGFARKPFGYDNPPAGLLSDALAVPQVQRTLDRLSYGEPLTTGKGQVTALRPDTVDAAMAVAPVVAKWPKQTGGLLAAVAGGGVGPDDAMRAMTPLARAERALEEAKAVGFVDSTGNVWRPSPNPIDRSRGSYTLAADRAVHGRGYRMTGYSPGAYGPAATAREIGGTEEDARGMIEYLSNLRGIRNNRNIERDVEAFVNKQVAPITHPDWAQALTRTERSTAAGVDWWERALKDKSRRSVDAFTNEYASIPGGLLFGPGTQSKSADDVATAFSVAGRQVSAEWIGDTLRFKTPGGYLDIMGATSDPVIRSTGAASKGKAGGDGKLLYQAAYQWLANNGRMAAPDVGLSEINQLRKVGNELSAQVRNGRPSAVMNTDRLKGVQDIPALWAAESKESASRVPSVGKLSFDGTQFLIGRKPVTDADITASIAAIDPTFEQGVGPMTAKRGAIYRWLQKASPEQAATAAKLLAAGAAAGTSGAVFADQSK